jgi:type II secretory pathway component GspD/PulD (secretin)
MLAKNGQSMFIGGLIEDTKSAEQYAIPCLGSIPGLGLLFGSMSDKISKSELIILITPQIIDLENPRTETEALEKMKKMEETLKKEPLPMHKRLLETMP